MTERSKRVKGTAKKTRAKAVHRNARATATVRSAKKATSGRSTAPGPAVSKKALQVTRRAIEWKKVKDLLLDSKNPRIPPEYEGATERELLKLMARDYRLIEVGESLADEGFWPEEPLVAIPAASEGGPTGKFITVEGNRRLAALKLLLEPELAKSMKLSRWVELSSECRFALDEVPAVVHNKREEVTSFLGFRHITGILKWEPGAKARWISSLVAGGERSFTEVAKEIGSKTPTVRDNYVAFQILNQARGFGFETSYAEDDFSVLYRALSTPGVRSYIGVDLEKTEKQLVKPVPSTKRKELGELLIWMFGDEDTPPAMDESRQIDELGEVLADKKATTALRSSGNLDYAYQMTGGEERKVIDHLEEAAFHLDEALSQVHRHRSSEDVEEVVDRCAETMIEITRHFPDLELDKVAS